VSPAIADLHRQLAEAERALDAIGANDCDDPAASRLGRAALRQHHKRMDSQLTRYVELTARIAALKHKIKLAQEREESARARNNPPTREDLAGATAIRDSTGWHTVVRVNAKSVSVPSD
jgi:multidrug resistance efflux pump